MSDVSKWTKGYLHRTPRGLSAWPAINVGGVERVVSSLLGVALVIYGLKRRDIPGVLIATAGSALTERGLSGRCPAFNAAGVSSA